VEQFLDDSEAIASQPEHLAFEVTPDLDVYSNIEEMTPWWKLGNLKADSIGDIMRRFEEDKPLGMQAHFHVPVSELAEKYGQRESRKVYVADDLKSRLVRQWAQDEWERTSTRNSHTKGIDG